MMPVCIYCVKHKPAEYFSKEHVLPRAFCGEGNNWTLIDTVCSECNVLFSAYEYHWTHNAFESIMRNFSGPAGRKRKRGVRRAKTTDSDHIYIVKKGSPLVFEAGFAFPNDLYFRPQIIQSDDGLVTLAADMEDAKVFESEMSKLIRQQMIKLSWPIDNQGKRMFQMVALRKDEASKSYSVCFEKEEATFSGYRFRYHPEPSLIRRYNGVERHLTPRCALDDKNRVYFRANGVSEVLELMSNLLRNKNACQTTSSHEQPIEILRIDTKLPIVFRAVLKTGLNLFAYLAGANLAKDAAFADLRNILLDKNADQDVMERCKFLGSTSLIQCRSKFPTRGNAEQHRLMLDIFRGKLYFRLQLYGSLGYEGILAEVTPSIQNAITVSRVVVDFNKNGFREVSNWPSKFCIQHLLHGICRSK